ncbi:MAG: acyltransferase [Cyanobium sp. CZS 25K]|nr:acyltransferase [Cyanobium sp. CZS25K]
MTPLRKGCCQSDHRIHRAFRFHLGFLLSSRLRSEIQAQTLSGQKGKNRSAALCGAVQPEVSGDLDSPWSSRDGNGPSSDQHTAALSPVFWQGTAEALTGYWYIPFIMLIFAASPLFLQYIKLSLKIQLTIFSALIVVSMLVHRPWHNLSPIHSVIYFTPIYLLGIIYAMHQKAIADAIKSKSLHLGLATVALSALQVHVTGSYGNYHKSAIVSYAGFDLNILQKLLIIFFLLSVLAKLESRSIPLLSYLASISFGIYFIHPWVLLAFQRLSMERHLAFAPGPLIFLLKTLLILGISIGLAETLKRRLHQRSRYLIGY